MRSSRKITLVLAACLVVGVVACSDDDSSSPPGATPDASTSQPDASIARPDGGTDDGGATPSDAATDATEAGKVLADGLIDPVPYKSRADSPFAGVVLATYDHFEDWEDGAVNTPGVTPSSTKVGSDFSAALIDSVDGDDGTVDGTCTKDAGNCDSGFGNGEISFEFDAAALGALPTHVGIAWTDGSAGCDATFEAYDSADVLIGSKTAEDVGDANNSGGVDEDRYFAVVHAAGVKKIVVKSSAGGVEVDHLHYGR